MHHTVYAPGSFIRDIEAAMEDYEREVADGVETDPDITAIVAQYWDEDRRKPRGRGFTQRFDISTPGQARFLRREAVYRYEYQGGSRHNVYGNESPEGGKRKAAHNLIMRCDEIIALMQ